MGKITVYENGRRKGSTSQAFNVSTKKELMREYTLEFSILNISSSISFSERENEEDKIILDAPTLFESGADSLCSDTCAVLSDEKTRLVRIISRDGITEEAAKLRISAC